MSGMGVMYASMACQVWESGRRGGLRLGFARQSMDCMSMAY